MNLGSGCNQDDVRLITVWSIGKDITPCLYPKLYLWVFFYIQDREFLPRKYQSYWAILMLDGDSPGRYSFIRIRWPNYDHILENWRIASAAAPMTPESLCNFAGTISNDLLAASNAFSWTPWAIRAINSGIPSITPPPRITR